jgi:hypothetical protein
VLLNLERSNERRCWVFVASSMFVSYVWFYDALFLREEAKWIANLARQRGEKFFTSILGGQNVVKRRRGATVMAGSLSPRRNTPFGSTRSAPPAARGGRRGW